MQARLKKLRRFNLIMGGFHFIQAIIMLFLATSVIQTISEFSPTITQFYLSFNPDTQSLELAQNQLFDLPFGIGVSLFLYSERVYIILSLVAKSILAWLVLFGAMQP